MHDGDRFGGAVSIDGDTLVVGAADADGLAGADQGPAYVFRQSGGLWIEQQKLTATDAAGGDGFGGAVSINGDTLVVGLPAMVRITARRTSLSKREASGPSSRS